MISSEVAYLVEVTPSLTGFPRVATQPTTEALRPAAFALLAQTSLPSLLFSPFLVTAPLAPALVATTTTSLVTTVHLSFVPFTARDAALGDALAKATAENCARSAALPLTGLEYMAPLASKNSNNTSPLLRLSDALHSALAATTLFALAPNSTTFTSALTAARLLAAS
jgi:hypothetical protein